MSSQFKKSPPKAPHHWRVRKDGLNDLLAAKGWDVRELYAEKMGPGQMIMLTAQEDHDGSFIVRVERKGDYWRRQVEDRKRRIAWGTRPKDALLWHAYNHSGDHTDAVSRHDLIENLHRHLERVRKAPVAEPSVIKVEDGIYELYFGTERWFLFQHQSDAEKAGFTKANYRVFDHLYTDLTGPKPIPRYPGQRPCPRPFCFQGEIGRKREEKVTREFMTALKSSIREE